MTPNQQCQSTEGNKQYMVPNIFLKNDVGSQNLARCDNADTLLLFAEWLLLFCVISVSSEEVLFTAECPVCLQPCSYPVQLPCSHVFCFLCVKGVAGRNRRCALCRADIPQDFLRRPTLVGKDAVDHSASASADRQQLNGGRLLCLKIWPVILYFVMFSIHVHAAR